MGWIIHELKSVYRDSENEIQGAVDWAQGWPLKISHHCMCLHSSQQEVASTHLPTELGWPWVWLWHVQCCRRETVPFLGWGLTKPGSFYLCLFLETATQEVRMVRGATGTGKHPTPGAWPPQMRHWPHKQGLLESASPVQVSRWWRQSRASSLVRPAEGLPRWTHPRLQIHDYIKWLLF